MSTPNTSPENRRCGVKVWIATLRVPPESFGIVKTYYPLYRAMRIPSLITDWCYSVDLARRRFAYRFSFLSTATKTGHRLSYVLALRKERRYTHIYARRPRSSTAIFRWGFSFGATAAKQQFKTISTPPVISATLTIVLQKYTKTQRPSNWSSKWYSAT